MSEDSSGPGGMGPQVNTAVLDAIEPYLEALADRIAERLTRSRDRMINQHDSELGPRRHREAVKRRIANSEGGAGHVGRNYLLTKEAIREELAGKGRRGGRGAPPAPAPAPSNDGSPSSGSSPARSRARDLATFEKDLMRGLHAVKGRA